MKIKNMKLYKKINKPQKGFTLVELLVAVVLLALAFTSMLLLQANTMRYTATAYYRGIASQVASGLASSVRANPRGLTHYKFEDAYNPESTISANSCINPSPIDSCDAAKIAATDIAWARQSARNQLPGGDLLLFPTTGVGADKNYVDMTLIWIPAKGKSGEINGFPCDAGVADGHATAQCLSIRVKI